jgi:hypothetical protein
MLLRPHMTTVDAAQTVAQVVREHEETRPILRDRGVEVSHVSGLSLSCTKRGINQGELLDELDRAIAESDAFDLGGFEWDVRADIVRLSPNLARMLELSELRGSPRTILDRVHPDDRTRVEGLFADAAAHPSALSRSSTGSCGTMAPSGCSLHGPSPSQTRHRRSSGRAGTSPTSAAATTATTSRARYSRARSRRPWMASSWWTAPGTPAFTTSARAVAHPE